MWCSEGRRDRRAVAVGLALAIGAAGGCAIVPPAPVTQAQTPATVREWSGRFATTVESNLPGGGQDAAAGRFALVSRPVVGGRRLEIALSSPFGQTLATGYRDVSGASTLKMADGRTLSAPTLDALMERALGWPLPIERLPDWLDDRFESILARDSQGRVSLAEDSGWRIEREPRRWALQRPHGDSRLRVVLVLDR